MCSIFQNYHFRKSIFNLFKQKVTNFVMNYEGAYLILANRFVFLTSDGS